MRTLNITITGNIASGKTTLTRRAARSFDNACYVPEPYESNPFLSLYLQDQSRWGFTSTLHYFWDYARQFAQIAAKESCAYCFVDAGTWTNRLVYGEYLHHEQIIKDDEFVFYQALCDLIERYYQQPPPDGFIFVNASPQTCWERMHQRGWNYQTTTIQLAYIEALHRYFDAMKQMIAAKNIPLLEISSEEINFTVPQGEQEALRRIEGFLARDQRPHP